jgi:hypothetical protein
MNVTLFRDGVWSSLGQISCLAQEMRRDLEFVLGIDPTEAALAQAAQRVDLTSYLFPFFKAFTILLCVPQGWRVLKNPTDWLRASSGSAAVYPAYWDLAPVCEGGVLLQVLDGRGITAPYAETSYHYHAETTEGFYPLIGKPEIRTNLQPSWSELAWEQSIDPYERHQLRVARGEIAITIIRMKGPHALLTPDKRRVNLADHHYSSW